MCSFYVSFIHEHVLCMYCMYVLLRHMCSLSFVQSSLVLFYSVLQSDAIDQHYDSKHFEIFYSLASFLSPVTDHVPTLAII